MEDLLDCALVNGYVVQYPKGYLCMNGHDYESLLKEKFAGLGALIRGQAGDAALKLSILRVIRECKEFLSVDIEKTFSRILLGNI